LPSEPTGRYADRKAVVLICGGNPSPAIRDLLT